MTILPTPPRPADLCEEEESSDDGVSLEVSRKLCRRERRTTSFWSSTFLLASISRSYASAAALFLSVEGEVLTPEVERIFPAPPRPDEMAYDLISINHIQHKV